MALLVHLAEFDARRLYEGAGFSSTFQYCRGVLKLSEDEIYNRIEAARALREYPVITDMLLGHALSPTTVRMLRPHLTAANHSALLKAASGMGKRDTEHLLACWFPQPDVAASVRKMPAPRGNVVPAPVPTPTPVTAEMASLTAPPPLDVSEDARRADALPDGADSPSGSAPVPSIGRPGSAASAWPRPVVRPLAPQRYEIRFTAGLQTRDKLREAQDLLSHAIPNGDVAEVVDRALTVLLVELRRRKFAATKRRRSAPTEAEVGASGSRAGGASSAAGGDGPARRSDTTTGGGDAPPSESESPATVKREVWQRDGGRCAFVAVDGQRCSATRLLEFHHVLPRGAGGRFIVANIQLRCRAHNGHEVDLFFGPGVRRARRELVYGPRRHGDLGRVDVVEPTSAAPTGSGTSAPRGLRRTDSGR